MSSIDKLRVAYAGDPGSQREAAFMRFLQERTASPNAIDRMELTSTDLSDADVLIVDGHALKSQTPSGLSLDSLRLPVVLVGGTGGKLADELALKLGWGYG